MWEHLQTGDLLAALQENTSFIGYTVNENWGLWNFNVYLNQRHLAFGLLIVTLVIYVFLDWLEAGTSHKEKGFSWFMQRILSLQAWKMPSAGESFNYGTVAWDWERSGTVQL